MQKKLHSILLVDDDKDCNFFHQRLISKMDCVEKVYTVGDGQEALNFLQSTESINKPDIIFLDLNMPHMNGWEFIDAYEKLDENIKARVVIIMLTTALNTSDIERGNGYKAITGYRNKYLDKETMKNILEEYFEIICE